MRLGEALGFSKTATFNATIQVHELLQVPLLHAKFRIKWKFKGATSHSLLEAATDDPSSPLSLLPHSTSHHGHGFGKRFLHPRSALHHVTSGSTNGTLASPSPPSGESSSGLGGGYGRERSFSPGSGGRWDSGDDGDDPGFRSPSRSPPLSPDAGRTPNPNRTPAVGGSGFAFTSPFSPSPETLYAHGRTATMDTAATGEDSTRGARRGGGDLSAMHSIHGLTQGGAGGGGAHRPEPRGSTSFIPLRQHTATFNREITCPVSIPLRSLPSSSSSRGAAARYELQPSPVRLSLKQEVLAGADEGGKREEVRLGEVVLDLSQFVGQKNEDVRPRRYLLQDCKSNAVLRVTVRMELIEGEANFVAPPLRSGQVSAHSSVAKGLASTQNSPFNRSTASLNASKPPAAARLSTSTFSTSRTGSSSGLARADSVSSTGSSRSQSLASSQSKERERDKLGFGMTRTASAGTVNAARNGRGKEKRGKKKGWHPPSSALAFSTLSSPSPVLFPGSLPSSLSFNPSSGTPVSTERSATELVDQIFNRPPRAPSWVGFSAASRPTTPTVEQDGFELTPASGEGRKARERKSAPARGLSADEREKPAGKAWSIRSGIERHQERKREKREAKADAAAGKKVERGISSADVARMATEAPSVEVQPPTPQPSLQSSGSYTSYPSRPAPPVPRPPSVSSSVAMTPSASFSSSVSSSNGGGNGRALSVRWGDAPTAASSSAASTPPTTVPSAGARSLRHSKSTESIRSTKSAFSTRSARSARSTGSGKERPWNPGLGLSEADEGSLEGEGTPRPGFFGGDDSGGGGGGRPPSQLSFNSVVTPPSPEKRSFGSSRRRPESRASDREGKMAGGRGVGAKSEREGQMAPGGMQWGNSWGS
ncbi:hypothetical protein JCM10213v2_003848 [Rhodosporidiobolus nylandii]